MNGEILQYATLQLVQDTEGLWSHFQLGQTLIGQMNMDILLYIMFLKRVTKMWLKYTGRLKCVYIYTVQGARKR